MAFGISATEGAAMASSSSEIIEEFRPGSDCVELDPSPLCCRSWRRRSWSGWGGIDQRDGIIDLRAAAGLKKRTSEARTGSQADRLTSGSKPNTIGADHNEAIGRRMTHSQGSTSVARQSALIVSHPRYSRAIRFCRTKILRSSREWRASTPTPILAFPSRAFFRRCHLNKAATLLRRDSSTPARPRWPEADPINTTVTQSYHRETASTQKAEPETTGGHISGARPVDQVERRRLPRAAARGHELAIARDRGIERLTQDARRQTLRQAEAMQNRLEPCWFALSERAPNPATHIKRSCMPQPNSLGRC